MRPPILYLTVAFSAGVFAALNGAELRVTAWCVLVAALALSRRAPLGAAVGVMLVAGLWWGASAARERTASCAGIWGRETGHGTRASVVRLRDPISESGG